MKQKIIQTALEIKYLKEFVDYKKDEFALLKAVQKAIVNLREKKQGDKEMQKLQELEKKLKNI